MKLKEQVKGFIDYKVKTLETTDEYIDIEGYGSTIHKDRDGDIVLVTGIDTSNFEKNPIILYQHRREFPIGKAIQIEKRDDGLYIKARIFKDMNKEAYVGIKNGVLKTFSIGFIGKDGEYDQNTDTFYFKNVELLEVSIVSIPANANATFDIAKSLCENGMCFVERNFSKLYEIDKAIEKITIKNDEISARAWGDVDKTRLGQILDDVNDKKAINECYLYVEDYEKRSTWCCPHHEIKNDGTMVVNKGGVIAAYQALKGAHGNKPNIHESVYKKAMEHLTKHYKEMYKQGLISEIPDDLKEFDDFNQKDITSDLINQLVNESGISKNELTKILMFLNFSLYKEDGSKTKFATKYKFKKDTAYNDLYEWLKEFKVNYKNDHEREAFSKMLKDLSLSTISRASAWIYKTYVVRQDNVDNKLLTSRTFAESWFFNTLGITTENLKKFGKVVRLVDENKETITNFINGIDYTNSNKSLSEGEDIVEGDSMKQIEDLTKSINELVSLMKQQIEQEQKGVKVVDSGTKEKTISFDEALDVVIKGIASCDAGKAFEVYSKIEKATNEIINKSLK